MGDPQPEVTKGTKAIYIGAPACFALEAAMVQVNAAFGVFCSYVVGSALERADWRDVDVRMLLDDETFAREFPRAEVGHYEFDAKWLLVTVAVSEHLRKLTGLPIDFQIQPTSIANSRHKGKRRNAIGFPWRKPE